jgi:hypothetical protein
VLVNSAKAINAAGFERRESAPTSAVMLVGVFARFIRNLLSWLPCVVVLWLVGELHVRTIRPQLKKLIRTRNVLALIVNLMRTYIFYAECKSLTRTKRRGEEKIGKKRAGGAQTEETEAAEAPATARDL